MTRSSRFSIFPPRFLLGFKTLGKILFLASQPPEKIKNQLTILVDAIFLPPQYIYLHVLIRK
jgi:hypothetical protein